jgi:hypothetical protein
MPEAGFKACEYSTKVDVMELSGDFPHLNQIEIIVVKMFGLPFGE